LAKALSPRLRFNYINTWVRFTDADTLFGLLLGNFGSFSISAVLRIPTILVLHGEKKKRRQKLFGPFFGHRRNTLFFGFAEICAQVI